MSSTAVSFFNEDRFPLTSKIIPDLFNYQGLSTSQKIVKLFKELFKTMLCCTGIIPAITTTIDFFTKKKTEVITDDFDKQEAEKMKKQARNVNYLIGVTGLIILGFDALKFPILTPLQNSGLIALGLYFIGCSTRNLLKIFKEE